MVNHMSGTGIIRRIDDLGRIVLPKEIRNRLGIKADTPMEISIKDKCIILEKYTPNAWAALYDKLNNICDQYDYYFEQSDRAAVEESIKQIVNAISRLEELQK